MLRAMNRVDSNIPQPFSLGTRMFAPLLCSAALLLLALQLGCSASTSTATADAVLAPGQFNANMSSVNLGNVSLGDTKTATVTFTNSANSSVTILTISISGAGFNAGGIPSGTVLNPGQTATLSVSFTPASTGSVSGSITVTSNAQNSAVTVNLQAAGVPAGVHLATLSWNSGGPSAVGYFIYRGTTSGGPYTRINTMPDVNTTYPDSAVVAGQSYYWVVTAVNSNNVESSYSNEVSATIPTP